MKYHSFALFSGCLLAPVAFAACSSSDPDTNSQAIKATSLVGRSYKQARLEIIEAGWEPIKATCTERLVCFGEPEIELATNLDSGLTCGGFRKREQSLTVCVESIADDERVISVDPPEPL